MKHEQLLDDGRGAAGIVNFPLKLLWRDDALDRRCNVLTGFALCDRITCLQLILIHSLLQMCCGRTWRSGALDRELISRIVHFALQLL